MKRIFINVMMAAAVLTSSAMLVSCSKDDSDEPEAVIEDQTPIDQVAENGGNNTGGGTTNTGGGTTNNPTDNPIVTPPPVIADYSKVDCLNGSDYFVFRLNADAYAYLETQNKIKERLDVDDVNTKFYVWENTYTVGKLTGKDCFGNDTEGGITSINNGGWCGGGWCRLTPFDYSQIDESYTLHISLRCNKSCDDWYMAFQNPQIGGPEYKITKDSKDINGNYFDLNTNGEWKEFEFSIADMIDAGVELINFDGSKGINFPCYGGFVGATVDMDAIFIYKKK